MKSSGSVMEILYLDNHLLVLHKPRGLLTLPSMQETDCLLARAKVLLKEKFQKPGNVFLHPVHRLDRSASGIVVHARTSKALTRLNASIRNGEWQKIYLLRHEGLLPEKEGEIVSYLKRGDYRTELVAEGEGKKAVLRYRSLGNNLVEVHLLTGRYHQIRAQFASLGCPLIGDAKYGASTKGEGIDLHHTKLTFPHPITQEPVELKVSPSWL